MSDWNFARVWDDIAALAPDRTAIICGETHRSFGEFEHRAARIAGYLARHGIGPGSKVALDLINRPEYLEGFYAALKLGAVPVNVNFRYGVEETRYLLEDSDAAAIITEPAFVTTVRKAAAALVGPQPVVLEIGTDYEQAIGLDLEPPTRVPSGDDLLFLYTGGTTGMPKGVMWRTDDLYVALWQMGRPGTEPPDPRVAVGQGKRPGTALPACPLMHGTGQFITLSTLSGGGCVVLIDEVGLNPVRVWTEVDRHEVAILTIVGDVFARPLLHALESEPARFALDSLRAITSSGVTWSPEVKRGLLNHLPGVTLLDSLGASEGLMTRSESRAEDREIAPARFAVNDRVKVFTDNGEEVRAGSEDVGMVAVGGRIPLGYYKDPVKSASTFRTVDGVRYSIPGDYASIDADGTIKLLGRGSATVNTGGEKVYPEEVELVIREHRAVADCVVIGMPDARFGEIVVAMLQPLQPTGECDEASIRMHCKERGLSGYKIPKRVIFVKDMHRAPNGKADYKLLRALAATELGVDA